VQLSHIPEKHQDIINRVLLMAGKLSEIYQVGTEREFIMQKF
jgi:hypothetical protein